MPGRLRREPGPHVRVLADQVPHLLDRAVLRDLADEPGRDVVARLVVEVAGVLRREQDAEAAGPCAAKQIEHRLLRGRRADRRHVGIGLVEEGNALEGLRRPLARETRELDQQARDPELEHRDLGEGRGADDRELGTRTLRRKETSDVEGLPVTREERTALDAKGLEILGQRREVALESTDRLEQLGIGAVDRVEQDVEGGVAFSGVKLDRALEHGELGAVRGAGAVSHHGREPVRGELRELRAFLRARVDQRWDEGQPQRAAGAVPRRIEIDVDSLAQRGLARVIGVRTIVPPRVARVSGEIALPIDEQRRDPALEQLLDHVQRRRGLAAPRSADERDVRLHQLERERLRLRTERCRHAQTNACGVERHHRRTDPRRGRRHGRQHHRRRCGHRRRVNRREVEIEDGAHEGELCDRPRRLAPRIQPRRICLGEGAQGTRGAELGLLEGDRATTGLDELPDLLRRGRLGLELEVSVAHRERREARRGELLECVELLAEVSPLGQPVAHGHDALPERSTFDVEPTRRAVEAMGELQPNLVRSCAERVVHEREDPFILVGERHGCRAEVVPHPIELGVNHRWRRGRRLGDRERDDDPGTGDHRRRRLLGLADERAFLDACSVVVAKLREHVACAELAHRFHLRGRERVERFIIAPRDVELRVEVLEAAHEHLLDLVELPLPGQAHGARIALEPIDERPREPRAHRCVDVIEARDDHHGGGNRVGDGAEAIERLLEPRDGRAVGDGLLDLIHDNHHRGHLQLVHDRRELLDRAQRILGLVTRREPSEQLAVVTGEGLAPQVLDDPALQRRISALQEQQRVEHVDLERLEPFGADDAIDDAADRRVELRLGELRGAQPLEVIGRDGHATFGEPIRQVHQR